MWNITSPAVPTRHAADEVLGRAVGGFAVEHERRGGPGSGRGDERLGALRREDRRRDGNERCCRSVERGRFAARPRRDDDHCACARVGCLTDGLADAPIGEERCLPPERRDQHRDAVLDVTNAAVDEHQRCGDAGRTGRDDGGLGHDIG